MDGPFIKELIIKYKSFKQKLLEQIKSSEIKLLNNECYLISDFWDNTLNRNIDCYEISNSLINFTLPKENPEFINNISFFVEYIKKQKKAKLISKEFMNLINGKLSLNLNTNTTINYFTGNNKLIIEFKGINEKYAILINCPLLKYQLYFIEIQKDDNRSLYKEILSTKQICEEIIVKEFNKVIFSKEDFINNRNISVSYFKSNNISKDKNNEKKNLYNKYKHRIIDSKKYAIMGAEINNYVYKNDNNINFSRSYSTNIKPRNRSIENINKNAINNENSLTESNLNLLYNQTRYPFSSRKKSLKNFFINNLEKEKNIIIKKELSKCFIIEEDKKTLNELIEENKILKNKENEYLNEINNYKEKILKKDQEIKSITNKFEKQINELRNDNYKKNLIEINNLLREKIRKYNKKKKEYI